MERVERGLVGSDGVVKPLWVGLAIFACFPVGLYLLWRHPTLGRDRKWWGFGGAWSLVILVMMTSGDKSKKATAGQSNATSDNRSKSYSVSKGAIQEQRPITLARLPKLGRLVRSKVGSCFWMAPKAGDEVPSRSTSPKNMMSVSPWTTSNWTIPPGSTSRPSGVPVRPGIPSTRRRGSHSEIGRPTTRRVSHSPAVRSDSILSALGSQPEVTSSLATIT